MAVGREYQHLEDLVYINGTRGIQQAIDFLQKKHKFHVKYDGYSVVEFKTTEYFLFATSNSKKQGVWFKSADDLADFVVRSGKQESWRKQYAKDLHLVFDHLKSLGKSGSAELLWSPYNPPTNKSFTPNLVTYTSDKEIKQPVGIALHTCNNINDFNNQYVNSVCDRLTHKCRINTSVLQRLESISANKNIDQLIEPEYGLSDIKNLFYRYTNWCNKRNRLDAIKYSFSDWLKDAKISESKKARLAKRVDTYRQEFNLLFDSFSLILQAKDDTIKQLDQLPRSYAETTNSKPGGEGYIEQTSKIKLVPRHRWKPK